MRSELRPDEPSQGGLISVQWRASWFTPRLVVIGIASLLFMTFAARTLTNRAYYSDLLSVQPKAAAAVRLDDIVSVVPSWASHPNSNPRGLRLGVDSDFNAAAAKYFSQDEEDKHLFQSYFHLLFDGFYIEMGAIDGVLYSNTKFFADSLGWRGLLIEPAPDSFSQLAQNRPSDLCLRTAICSKHGMVEYITSTVSAVNGILEFMSPAFKQKWHPDIQKGRDEGRVTMMPCVPLQGILDHYDIRVVDFFSLDVEGAELEVLKTIDFTRVHFSVVLVECDGSNPEKELAIKQLLLAHGFLSHGMVTRNSLWFVHKDIGRTIRPYMPLNAQGGPPPKSANASNAIRI